MLAGVAGWEFDVSDALFVPVARVALSAGSGVVVGKLLGEPPIAGDIDIVDRELQRRVAVGRVLRIGGDVDHGVDYAWPVVVDVEAADAVVLDRLVGGEQIRR